MAEESNKSAGGSIPGSGEDAAVHIVYVDRPGEEEPEAFHIRTLASVVGGDQADALSYSLSHGAEAMLLVELNIQSQRVIVVVSGGDIGSSEREKTKKDSLLHDKSRPILVESVSVGGYPCEDHASGIRHGPRKATLHICEELAFHRVMANSMINKGLEILAISSPIHGKP
ncbi:hypothetical protein MA16_Dca007428 [Dendrobium catenatum]|uniref:Uncharacterized protein n=1 Tax=Dendrobium catenatum TaxID=906689 RepID=A0A2I0WAM2_9ASPA|nr:hypothetical protein MA16_Dca007428 [Dendrobium catenatum]